MDAILQSAILIFALGMFSEDIDNRFIKSLFLKHYPGLCDRAYRIVRDRAAAEDVVQGVFLKVWDKRAEIEIGTAWDRYLYRAVTNASLNYLEKEKRLISSEGELSGRQRPEDRPDVIHSGEELREAIERALDTLPPKCRAIFVLNRYEGQSYKEIAELLGVSFHTVKSQMSIALAKLKKELGEYLK